MIHFRGESKNKILNKKTFYIKILYYVYVKDSYETNSSKSISWSYINVSEILKHAETFQ